MALDPDTPVFDLAIDVPYGRDVPAVASAVAALVGALGRPSRTWQVSGPGGGYVATQILELPPLSAADRTGLWTAVRALPHTHDGEMADTQLLTAADTIDPAFEPDHTDLDAILVAHTAAGGVPGRAWWWPGIAGPPPEPAPASASRRVADKLRFDGPLAAGLCEPAEHRSGTSDVVTVWTPHVAAAAGVDDTAATTTLVDPDSAWRWGPMQDLGNHRGVIAAAISMLTELWETYGGIGRRPFAPDTDPTIATHNLLELTARIDDPADVALLHWLLAAEVTLP